MQSARDLRRRRRRLNVVLFSSGSAGDILPFLRVGSALVSRGHNVHFITHCGYDRLAEEAGLRYQPFDSPAQYAEFLSEAALLNTPGGIPRFLRKHSLPRAGATLELIKRVVDADTLLLTSPTFDTVSRMAAESTGVTAMWLFIAPVQVSQWQQRRLMRTAMFSKVLGEDINTIRAQAGMPAVHDWDSWLEYSAQSIGQWPDWFAQPDQLWLPGVRPVGFLVDHPAERTELPVDVTDFLAAAERPPVLITGGTGRYLGKKFYAASIIGAAQLDLPVIVVTRDQNDLPEHVPSKCFLAEKLPFGSLMPQCSAVIHHGGLGTLAAAAAAGLPQLILAFGADRPDNGSRVETLGIGKCRLLLQCRPHEIAESLSQLTQSSVIAKRCQHASEMILAHDAAAVASEIAEEFSALAGDK